MSDIDLIMSHEQRHIERNLYRSRLIELVRANPILWDKKSPDFNQRTLKIQKWLEVSEQLGVSTDKLRRTWENLRDQYRRDLKRTLGKNIRSKWRFYDDMNFIRSNVRIKGSSFGDGGNSDTESEYEDLTCDKYVSPLFTTNMISTQNDAEAATAPNTSALAMVQQTFHPIHLSTDWRQQQLQQQQQIQLQQQQQQMQQQQQQMQHQRQMQLRQLELDLEQNNPTAIHQVTQQQSCDSSEEQKNFNVANYVVNAAIQDVVKIEIDSDSSDSIPNQDIPTTSRPSTIFQRQELLAVSQPSTASTFTPTSSHNDSEACVTTSGNSTGTKCRRRHSSTIDTPIEEECKRSFRQQRQHHDATPQDSSELQDEDYHFVMSILPALRQVTRQRKFPLRSRIMALISKELEENND